MWVSPIDQDLRQELHTLKAQANLSVADILRVGVGQCAPLAGEAFHNGFMTGLADLYGNACDECQDEIMTMLPEPGSLKTATTP